MSLDVHQKRTVVMDADYADHAEEIREALHDECSRLASELETVRTEMDTWKRIAIRSMIAAGVLGLVVSVAVGYVLGRL